MTWRRRRATSRTTWSAAGAGDRRNLAALPAGMATAVPAVPDRCADRARHIVLAGLAGRVRRPSG